MNMKSNPPKAPAEQVVKDIRRATRRHYSTEDKIRIVLSGLRGEDRQHGNSLSYVMVNLYDAQYDINLKFVIHLNVLCIEPLKIAFIISLAIFSL